MQTVKTALSEVFQTLYGKDIVPEITQAPKPELGEYCINVFPLAKTLGKAPNIIALEVASELKKNNAVFVDTSATGGYVNFFLSTALWMEIYKWIDDVKQKGSNGKKALMEIFSLNVWKPIHIWHLCPTSTGQAIVNVHRYLGWEIIVDNHMGDWWSLFWKLIVWFQKYGNQEKLMRDGVEHLQELYVQINADIEKNPAIDIECKEAFKKLSKWDLELMKLWWQFTSTSLEKANKVIAKLHVYNDIAIGESFYEWLPLPKLGDYPNLQDNMDAIVKELIDKNIATKNEDWSVWIVFPEETKIPSTILEKRDGTHWYLASDLACVKYRMHSWNLDKISIWTDIRQELHFRQVFATARMAGWIREEVELVHVGNGFISLPDGAMSSRKWNIIRLEDLLEEGYLRTQKILLEKTRNLQNSDVWEIAIWAIKYSYLMQDRERNIVFDWDKALNFEWNSGPYIQYAYVRAKKIIEWLSFDSSASHIFELSAYDKKLIQVLQEFESNIHTVAKTYKPHHLATYSYDLAVSFNSFYVHTPKILEESDTAIKNFRLTLISKTTDTLKKSFELLGIKMPTEM
jgi:arginyl-tRNA synthetase